MLRAAAFACDALGFGAAARALARFGVALLGRATGASLLAGAAFAEVAFLAGFLADFSATFAAPLLEVSFAALFVFPAAFFTRFFEAFLAAFFAFLTTRLVLLTRFFAAVFATRALLLARFFGCFFFEFFLPGVATTISFIVQMDLPGLPGPNFLAAAFYCMASASSPNTEKTSGFRSRL